MQKNYKNDNENEENPNENESEQANNIGDCGQNVDCGIFSTKNAEHAIHILTIIGQVVIMDSISRSGY